MIAPPRGLSPLSPLELLVAEFVISTVPCPVCHVPTEGRGEGLVSTLRRSAALERCLGSQRWP
ncbi:MAG TPA: hypothetical protein VE196_09160 [Pseudonocardiaceae bacterium]|nr:hypothetical protein [Pseudonocardiaceae bacterium]